jgi:hypothetical protein
VRLHEKGGKYHEAPIPELESYLDERLLLSVTRTRFSIKHTKVYLVYVVLIGTINRT